MLKPGLIQFPLTITESQNSFLFLNSRGLSKNTAISFQCLQCIYNTQNKQLFVASTALVKTNGTIFLPPGSIKRTLHDIVVKLNYRLCISTNCNFGGTGLLYEQFARGCNSQIGIEHDFLHKTKLDKAIHTVTVM